MWYLLSGADAGPQVLPQLAEGPSWLRGPGGALQASAQLLQLRQAALTQTGHLQQHHLQLLLQNLRGGAST